VKLELKFHCVYNNFIYSKQTRNTKTKTLNATTQPFIRDYFLLAFDPSGLATNGTGSKSSVSMSLSESLGVFYQHSG